MSNYAGQTLSHDLSHNIKNAFVKIASVRH